MTIPFEFRGYTPTPSSTAAFRERTFVAYSHTMQTCPGSHCKTKKQSIGQFIAGSPFCKKCRARG